MTLTLGIEMSNPSASRSSPTIALARREQDGSWTPIASRPMLPSARGSDGVMALISDVCAEADVSSNEIDAIAVSIGPGGYTALRIATTSAKTLARMIGCPLHSVETARVASVAIPDDQLPALITLASKGERAYCSFVRVSSEGARSFEELGVVDASSLAQGGAVAMYADAHLPESFAQACAELGITIHPITLDAHACIQIAMGTDPVDPSKLVPKYAREPDAVTQWRERHGDDASKKSSRT